MALLSGIEESKVVLEKLKERIAYLNETNNIIPVLAIVQVGNREDSNVYINSKILKAKAIGMEGRLIKLDQDITQQELEDEIAKLNKDDKVDGIIIQLPLDCTKKIDVDSVIDQIDSWKDVDGLTRFNAGRLHRGEMEAITPCTPAGCLLLVKRALGDNGQLRGKTVTIVGRSKIVGAPALSLFLWANCTVTVCHSQTVDLKKHCQQADILLVAIGRKHFIKGDYVKPGAIVIDCGINVEPNEDKTKKNKIYGDVDTDEARKIASFITPVPGGVGPMTVAMLLHNTVQQCFARRLGTVMSLE
ncbi:unnamed protein product [Auanema sp. JU1783]|nr:unnamed protein product [Auanema sp. JU1783]